MSEEFDGIFELIDEEGEEVTFRLVDVLEYRDDTYLALEPVDEEAEDEDEETEIVFMLVTLFDLFIQKLEAEENETDGGDDDAE